MLCTNYGEVLPVGKGRVHRRRCTAAGGDGVHAVCEWMCPPGCGDVSDVTGGRLRVDVGGGDIRGCADEVGRGRHARVGGKLSLCRSPESVVPARLNIMYIIGTVLVTRTRRFKDFAPQRSAARPRRRRNDEAASGGSAASSPGTRSRTRLSVARRRSPTAVRRPIVDIDIYAPLDQAGALLDEIRGRIVWGPEHYRDEHWDLRFLKIDHGDVRIEIGDTDSFPRYCSTSGAWMDQTIDYGRSVPSQSLASWSLSCHRPT
jgi:hypothetical protein